MMAEFEGTPCLSFEATETVPGRLRVNVEFSEEPRKMQGLLTVDGVHIFGTLEDFGPYNGLFTAIFYPGFAGWAKPIEAQVMRGPIAFADVVKRIAATVGESVRVLPASDRVCESYTCTPGLALAVLEGLPWYVDDQGITVVGENRPGVSRTVEDVRVSKSEKSYGAIKGQADVFVRSGDTVQAYDGPVKLLEVHVANDGKFSGTVEGVPTLRDVLKIATADTSIVKLAECTFDAVERTFVSKNGAAPVPMSRVWMGPGVSADLANGTPIALLYFDGDRGRPIALACGPDVPPTEYRIHAAKVKLGPSGSVPVAMGPAVKAAFAAVKAACTAAAGAAAPLSLPSGPEVAAGYTAIATAIDGVLSTLESHTIFGDL